MSKRSQSRMLFVGVLSLVVLYGAMPAFAQETAQRQKKSPAPHVMVHRVKHQKARELLKTISVMTENSHGAPFRIAVDTGTNSLIVLGDEKAQELVESLLQSLDVEPKKPGDNNDEVQDLMIRVVWLIDKDLIEKDFTTIPPDLIPTVEKLSAKFGLGTLVKAGQIIINKRIVDDQVFEGNGTASVQGTSEFKVRGEVTLYDAQNAVLDLHVQVAPLSQPQPQPALKLQPPRKRKPVYELETTISTPIGRPVFIGMSSTESKASLFIVQVLDADAVMRDTAKTSK